MLPAVPAEPVESRTARSDAVKAIAALLLHDHHAGTLAVQALLTAVASAVVQAVQPEPRLVDTRGRRCPPRVISTDIAPYSARACEC